jgi:hypothetical protein
MNSKGENGRGVNILVNNGTRDLQLLKQCRQGLYRNVRYL